VRSIEHASEVSEDTARMIAESGTTYTVPTLAVIRQALDHGPELGLFPESLEKVKPVYEQTMVSLENCRRAGVKMGLGTDLFGPDYHHLQSHEFAYRGEVNTPLEVLRSATAINAEIVQMQGEVGTLAEGAYADMIALDGNPLQDLALFQHAEKMPLIMKGGVLKRDVIS